jgi:general secretion pathway protein A
MYETYYGLTGKPFQLNPDPAFYFGSSVHQRAQAYLEYGLHQSEGFLVITGEVGAGKTMLVRTLLNKLDTKKVVAAHLVSTQLDAHDMLRVVAAAFGLPIKSSAKSDLLLSLEMFMVSVATQGKRILLIVDEAQNLTSKAIEELRMLSNFQLAGRALLQSFLIGQPEFRETMQSHDMKQFCQRIIASYHIGPMDEIETRSYVEHRLHHVGWTNRPQFIPAAHLTIFENTGGVPRRINTLCDRLLLSGYLAKNDVFSADDVKQVVDEIRSEIRGGDKEANQDSKRESPISLVSATASRRESELSKRSDDTKGGAFALQAANLEERVAVLEQTLASVLERLPKIVGLQRTSGGIGDKTS